ncbi:hypothetical protein C4579_00450 [Candidatus Microgenomates bacterium]|nr:MAG: hypothetical protein C4579_00450 [Candidatus Microgenomates bacterium]
MRSTGTLLKEERLRKGFTLEQVEKSTKIRARYLEALEDDDFARLPALPYIQGFVRNYSTFLGLKSTTMLAIFRRQYTLKEKNKHEVIEEPIVVAGWQLTPNKVLAVLAVFIFLALFSYFYQQYRILHAPPPLTLEQPKEDGIVADEELPVFGTTDADSTLTINNEPVLVKEDGKFYKDVPLNIGNNTILIEATSRAGEKTTVVRLITRAP